MNEEKTRAVVESGFKFVVPEKTSFRFAECTTYQDLCGLSLKEMDIGWYNSSTGKLMLIELKGHELWDEFDQSKDSAHHHLVAVLKGKLTDTLLMLAAVWVETGTGKALKVCLPAEVHGYPGDGNLKLIFLIDTPPSRRSLLTPVKDAINRELAGRVRLFGAQRVSLVDFETAQKMGLPVERQI